MGGERLFLHALAGIEPRLLAVAGQRPDQGRVPPGDRQLQHQAVEAVVLRAAGPDRDDRVLEGLFQPGEDQLRAMRILELEVVHPDDLAVGAADGEARLDQRLQAHVVEDRQDVGERGRPARPIELEAELQLAVGGRTVGADGHGLPSRHALDHRQVLQRLGRIEPVAVAGREGVAVAGEGGDDLLRLAAGGADGGVEPVLPGARRFGDRGFQDLQVRLVVHARREADDVVHAGQGRVGEARIGGRDAAAVGLRQDLAGPRRQVGIVLVARQEQEQRGEAVEGVAPLEETHARAVVEVQDAQRLGEKVVLAHLEELVARVVLDDVLQAFLVVAAGRHGCAAQHIGHLLADQGHGRGGLVVGFRGEQADEADLADRPAVGAVPLDADVVHVAPAVHTAAHVRLGDGQGRVAEQPVPDVAQQDRGLVGAAQHRALRVAQDAQAVLGLVERLLGRVVPILQPRIFVDAGAEEDELLGLQPGQERDLLRIRARLVGLQLGHGAGHQGQHLREVFDRRADVLQGLGDAAHQGLLAVGADRIEDHLDHRLAPDLARGAADARAVALHLDDGMEEGANRQSLVGDLAHDRIDQEGRVVLHDFQAVQRPVLA